MHESDHRSLVERTKLTCTLLGVEMTTLAGAIALLTYARDYDNATLLSAAAIELGRPRTSLRCWL